MTGNARSGRKPLPTALKRLRGNPGKRPLNDAEPKPPLTLPACPDHITGAARRAWIDFAPALQATGIGTAIDSTALELLCTAYGAYLDASAEVARRGAVWLEKAEGDETPAFVYSPFWRVASQEWAKVKSMLSEFGMTPASRSRLRVEASAGGVSDEFDQFVAR
jgi:P27 family predicted phage terminase small subunit